MLSSSQGREGAGRDVVPNDRGCKRKYDSIISYATPEGFKRNVTLQNLKTFPDIFGRLSQTYSCEFVCFLLTSLLVFAVLRLRFDKCYKNAMHRYNDRHQGLGIVLLPESWLC